MMFLWDIRSPELRHPKLAPAGMVPGSRTQVNWGPGTCHSCFHAPILPDSGTSLLFGKNHSELTQSLIYILD
jgi:hypothetical protein